MHVVGQRGDGGEQRVELLGLVDIAGGDHQRAGAARLSVARSPAPAGAAPAIAAADSTGGCGTTNTGVRQPRSSRYRRQNSACTTIPLARRATAAIHGIRSGRFASASGSDMPSRASSASRIATNPSRSPLVISPRTKSSSDRSCSTINPGACQTIR